MYKIDRRRGAVVQNLFTRTDPSILLLCTLNKFLYTEYELRTMIEVNTSSSLATPVLVGLDSPTGSIFECLSTDEKG